MSVETSVGQWAHENGTICPFGVFFTSFIALFGPIWGNPCSEASCGVVTFSVVLKAFQWFRVLGPRIHDLSFSGPNVAFSSSQNTTF